MGDIVYRLTGDEGKAVKSFLRLTDAQKKAELGARKAGRATKTWDQAGQSLGRNAVRDIGSMVAGLATVGTALVTIRGEWRQHRQLIRESAEELLGFQKAFIDLQFLGEHFRDPSFRGKITGAAARHKIPAAEVSRAYYALESMTAYAPEAQRDEMFEALLRMRRTGSLAAPELVPTFAKMGAIYPGLSGVEMSNIAHLLTAKAAIGDIGELAAYAPKAFAAGKVGDIDARTAAAMFAVLTAQTGTTAQAATGMDVLIRKVMLEAPGDAEAIRSMAFGKASPLAGRKALLGRAGMAEGDDAYQRLLKLAAMNQEQGLSVQELKDLFGERGLKYGKILLEDPSRLRSMVQTFQKETGGDRDIIAGKLKAVSATDPIYRLTRGAEGIETMGGIWKQDPSRLLQENYWRLMKALWDKQGAGWTGRKAMSLDAALATMWGEGAMVGQVGQQLRAAGVVADEDVAGGVRMAREMLGLAAENLNAAAANLRAATETIPPANAHTE